MTVVVRLAVMAMSESDEAIHASACGAMDCFAALAMTVAAAAGLPDGQISNTPVYPRLQKYIATRFGKSAL